MEYALRMIFVHVDAPYICTRLACSIPDQDRTYSSLWRSCLVDSDYYYMPISSEHSESCQANLPVVSGQVLPCGSVIMRIPA